MLTKTVKYTDYNGVDRVETCHFNLNEAEITEMELGIDGGFAEMVQNIIKAKDIPAITAIFKKILLKAYGEKSADGRYFRKTDDNGCPLSRKFAESEVYSKIFMELATDADKAAEFINGITPDIKGKDEAVAKAKAEFMEEIKG